MRAIRQLSEELDGHRASASSCSTSAKQPPTPEEIESALATPLVCLRLPVRMVYYADREGLLTLGDIARRAPRDLLAEPNLGSKSMRAMREIIETTTGRRWEHLSASGSMPAVPDRGNKQAAAWDAMRAQLSDEERAAQLSKTPLPSRLRWYAARERLETLGDLAARSRADLMAGPGVGCGTIAELLRVLGAHLQSLREIPLDA